MKIQKQNIEVPFYVFTNNTDTRIAINLSWTDVFQTPSKGSYQWDLSQSWVHVDPGETISLSALESPHSHGGSFYHNHPSLKIIPPFFSVTPIIKGWKKVLEKRKYLAIIDNETVYYDSLEELLEALEKWRQEFIYPKYAKMFEEERKQEEAARLLFKNMLKAAETK